MKKVKTMLMIVVLTIGLFAFSGCNQAITPAQIKAATAKQQTLQTTANAIQTQATLLAEQLKAAGIVDANLVGKIAVMNAQADKYLAEANSIAVAIQQVQLTGDTTTDWITTIRAVNTATAPVNPYAPLIEGGLAAATILAGWLAKRKAAEAAIAQAKYQAHKQGVEKTMKEVSVSENADVKAVETQLYDNIGEARAMLGV